MRGRLKNENRIKTGKYTKNEKWYSVTPPFTTHHRIGPTGWKYRYNRSMYCMLQLYAIYSTVSSDHALYTHLLISPYSPLCHRVLSPPWACIVIDDCSGKKLHNVPPDTCGERVFTHFDQVLLAPKYLHSEFQGLNPPTDNDFLPLACERYTDTCSNSS